MDDADVTCDAGVSSFHHHHHYHDDHHHQQLQPHLLHNVVYSGWVTSSGHTRRPPTGHALTAADSTTTGPTCTSTDDALISNADVRSLYLSTLSKLLKLQRKIPGIEPSNLKFSTLRKMSRIFSRTCNCIAMSGYYHAMFSVCRLSVTRVYYDKTTKVRITRFSKM